MVCPNCGAEIKGKHIRRCPRCKHVSISLDIILVTVLLIPIGLFAVVAFFPGFIEPVHRSPLTRAKSGLRSIGMAIESYAIDHPHTFPAWSVRREEKAFGGVRDRKGQLAGLTTFRLRHGSALETLTTPVAFMNSYEIDPLAPVKGTTFCYWSRNAEGSAKGGYIVWSSGPDRVYDLTVENIARAYDPAAHGTSPYLIERTYDPSNGIASRGDVYMFSNKPAEDGKP